MVEGLRKGRTIATEWWRAEWAKNRVTPASCGNARGHRHGTRPRAAKNRVPRDHLDTASFGQAISRACQTAWPPPAEIGKVREAVDAWHRGHRWTPNQIRHKGQIHPATWLNDERYDDDPREWTRNARAGPEPVSEAYCKCRLR